MTNFEFKMPTKLIYGADSVLKLKDLCREFQAEKVFVVSGKHVSKTNGFAKLADSLTSDKLECSVYTNSASEPTIEAVDRAAAALKKSGCSLVVAVGGGSQMDLAKAICMLQNNEGSVRDYLFRGTRSVCRQSCPLLCVPTTAGSGSEVTAASVVEDPKKQVKLSVTHDYMRPRAAILDPAMQVEMPPSVTASTGMDALTHAIEAYVSVNSNLISDMFAEKAIRLICGNLVRAYRNPQNLDARLHMSVASTLAAVAFSSGGLGAVHGISQSLGGIAHIPHGIANAILLPFVIKNNIPGAVGKFVKIARWLGADTSGKGSDLAAECAVDQVFKLLHQLNLPTSLKKYGVVQNMFPQVVHMTMEYRLLACNPVPVTQKDVENILHEACC